MNKNESAQAQFREIARDLGAIKYRLRGVHFSVPLSPAESDPEAEVDVTTVAHFHGTLEGLMDEVDSLTHGVLEIASYPLGPIPVPRVDRLGYAGYPSQSTIRAR